MKSSYETLREENIKRNAQFLQSLGLDAVKPKKVKVDAVSDEVIAVTKRKRDARNRKNKDWSTLNPPAPTRRSSRIQSNESCAIVQKQEQEKGIAKEKEIQERQSQEEEDDEEEYYVYGIEDPSELDEFERSIYDEILRPWRLNLCKELETEPYKIFRNRTLVEFIRRKRNDRKFAVSSSSGKDSSTDFKKICSDLSECWGVGPASLREDGGFAHQMLNEIADNEEAEDLFHKSRLLSATSEITIHGKEYKYNEGSGELYDLDEPHAYIGLLNNIIGK